jgi:hypothetical protein
MKNYSHIRMYHKQQRNTFINPNYNSKNELILVGGMHACRSRTVPLKALMKVWKPRGKVVFNESIYIYLIEFSIRYKRI